jgi:hypothetical protein
MSAHALYLVRMDVAQRIVDINALRALAPPPCAPSPGHHAPSPARRTPAGAAGTAGLVVGLKDGINRHFQGRCLAAAGWVEPPKTPRAPRVTRRP